VAKYQILFAEPGQFLPLRRCQAGPIVLPSSNTSRTAPAMNSSVNRRRGHRPVFFDPTLDIVSAVRKMSTTPHQAHMATARVSLAIHNEYVASLV
jgi:hypothetical protein